MPSATKPISLSSSNINSFHNMTSPAGRLFTFLCVGVIIFNLIVTGCLSFPLPEHSSERDYTLQPSNGTNAVPPNPQLNNTKLPVVSTTADQTHAASTDGRVSKAAESSSISSISSSSNGSSTVTKRYVSNTASPISTPVATISNPQDPCQPPENLVSSLKSDDENYASIMSMNEFLQNRHVNPHDELKKSNETLPKGSYHHYTDSYFQTKGERNCEDIERILKRSAPKDALCPWKYNCTYDRERYPKYIIKAECENSFCKKGCDAKEDTFTYCQPLTYNMNVLKVKNPGACLKGASSTAEWHIVKESVALGCQCSSD